MILDRAGVDAALSALAEHLGRASESTVGLVVCGGSALEALDLVNRTTKDIDVLALATTVGESTLLRPAEPLPEAVVTAAAIVARDLGLHKDWLNPGPTGLLSEGLPDGLPHRLHPRQYGEKLTVHFIDRFDQICLKAYAAINGGAVYHLSDLMALDPSPDEMLSAARWCLTQDASDAFPLLVSSFVIKIGYPDVAEQLSKRD